jgi:hypothetical protein
MADDMPDTAENVATDQPRLTIIPLTLRRANAVIGEWHRHHQTARGCKFCIGVIDEAGELRGVAIVGRPVARMRDDGITAEVTRVATDGCPNACSALYGAAWRCCKAMGYRRLGTYILDHEPGTSLKAAGWNLIGERGGGSWSRENRLRDDPNPTGQKQLWEMTA